MEYLWKYNILLLIIDNFKFIKNNIDLETESVGKLKETVDLLINMRDEARLSKDFELSDKIRNRLEYIGIKLKDSKDGTTFSIEK